MQIINCLSNESINLNNQCGNVIQSFAELNSQRVISIVLPFLSLHSKTASAASYIARTYQLCSIWMEDSASKPIYNKFIDTLKLAGSVGAGIFCPSAQLLYSSVVFFLEQAQKFQKGGNWDKAASLYQIASQIVHLASIYYGTPKWVVLSLLSQAASEGYKAYHEERTPEAIALALLTAIHGYRAYSYSVPKKIEEVLEEQEELDLSGDLEAKIDARRYTIVDSNNKEYDFGSYFHGYGKYLVKGANLHFRRIVAKDGSKSIELSFKVNHLYEERLRRILQGLETMSPDEQRDFALHYQSPRMTATSYGTYFVGQKCNMGNIASVVTLDGLGSLMLGPGSFYSFKNHVKVTLAPSATLDSFRHFLSIFGLQDAAEKSSAEELEKIKIAAVFKTYFPTQAYDAEKEDDYFTLPLNQFKQKIIENIPAIKDIFEQQTVTKNELLPGCVKYGVKIDQEASSRGARALTAAVTGGTNPEKLAMILKYGLLSHEMRERNDISEGGINNPWGYKFGGAQSVFTQMITSQDLIKKPLIDALGYQSPIRLFISLKALNQGSYQYFDDYLGRKDSKAYRSRPALLKFIKKRSEWQIRHEVMIPRVLPEHIKAVSVNSQEIKYQLISQLRKNNLIRNERINGIPVDEFIRTERRLTPDMVKRCY
jgi:hypothetical protein